MAATARLKPLADNIWTVDFDFFNFGIHFPGRMTVVRLSDGGLWLHSPVPIDDDLAEELAQLGPVQHLVGPNLFHHVHLKKVKARYEHAQMWAAPGLKKKRSDLPFDHELTREQPQPWGAEIQCVPFSCAPRIGEVVFFHTPSRAMITTDLMMNVHHCQGLMSRFVYWAEGAYKKLAVPRLNQFLVKDKGEAAAFAAQLIALEPEHVLMAHGDIVSDDAAQRAAEALSVFKPISLVAARSA